VYMYSTRMNQRGDEVLEVVLRVGLDRRLLNPSTM
jgi:hypothetical protein